MQFLIEGIMGTLVRNCFEFGPVIKGMLFKDFMGESSKFPKS